MRDKETLWYTSTMSTFSGASVKVLSSRRAACLQKCSPRHVPSHGFSAMQTRRCHFLLCPSVTRGVCRWLTWIQRQLLGIFAYSHERGWGINQKLKNPHKIQLVWVVKSSKNRTRLPLETWKYLCFSTPHSTLSDLQKCSVLARAPELMSPWANSQMFHLMREHRMRTSEKVSSS